MALTAEQVEPLVIAALATYSYSLEKAWELRGAVRQAGLGDTGRVAGLGVQEVGNLMKQAGYDRGGITYIIAPRIISLAQAAQSGQLDGLYDLVARNAREEAVGLIGSVKGFGPKSGGIAWELIKPA
ncbi:MAG: hypothetical protein JW797_16755 [Bradymonadales bacterium]|nr:hypothetical protein [Bradymonadales bacterium]